MDSLHIDPAQFTPESRSLLGAGTFDLISRMMADPEMRAAIEARVAANRKA